MRYEHIKQKLGLKQTICNARTSYELTQIIPCAPRQRLRTNALWAQRSRISMAANYALYVKVNIVFFFILLVYQLQKRFLCQSDSSFSFTLSVSTALQIYGEKSNLNGCNFTFYFGNYFLLFLLVFGGFRWVLQFPPPLTTDLAYIWQKE